MPQPRKVSDEGMAEIEAVAVARSKLPEDKELAVRYRISEVRVRQIMRAVREKLKLSKPIRSTWIEQGTIGPSVTGDQR